MAGPLVVCLLVGATVARPEPAASAVRLPAAGRIVQARVVARVRPAEDARAVRILREFRPDGRYQVILAVGQHRAEDGRLWYRLDLPMRPNGTRGWVPAAALGLRSVRKRIVIDRSTRILRLRHRGRSVLRARVAVGARGRETPLGRFYVTARFKPTDPVLGAFAFETSAYSKLTDWPGGGVVGIHGTNQPWLLGQAVSHGCVRVANRTILRLRRLVLLGTPIFIRR